MAPSHRLAGRVIWLIGHASVHAQRLITQAFASGPLRRQHYGILASLAEGGAAAQTTIGDRLSIDRSDLVSLIDELEVLGLVTRRPDDADRRRNIVEVTDAGRDRLAELDAKVDAAEAELLTPFTPTEQKLLANLLDRLMAPDDPASDLRWPGA